jgi:hypothetical protein
MLLGRRACVVGHAIIRVIPPFDSGKESIVVLAVPRVHLVLFLLEEKFRWCRFHPQQQGLLLVTTQMPTAVKVLQMSMSVRRINSTRCRDILMMIID